MERFPDIFYIKWQIKNEHMVEIYKIYKNIYKMEKPFQYHYIKFARKNHVRFHKGTIHGDGWSVKRCMIWMKNAHSIICITFG
jgi:hypothetical protein